eukprot:GHRQ01014681.1.p1 GENE.GHRQ01014681.1~~GHRQ01014681.1.p1  ORF type:complete len:625 (+),score=225.88 GHRQ01014681.1:542-2416(+)
MQGLSSNNPFAAEAGSNTGGQYSSSGTGGQYSSSVAGGQYSSSGSGGQYSSSAAGGQYSNSGAAPGYQPVGGSQYYPSVPQPAPGAPQTYPGMYAAAPGAAAPGVPPPAGQYGVAAHTGHPPYAAPGTDVSNSGSGPAAYGYPPVTGSNSGSTPPTAPQGAGAGWTPESVRPAAAAAPGQFGHYGHLQYAPSFNTSSGTAQAVTAAVSNLSLGPSGAVDAAPSAGGAAGAVPGGLAGKQQLAGQPPVEADAWALQGAHLPQKPQQQVVGPQVRFNDYDPASGNWAVSVLVVSSPELAGSTLQLHYAADAPASQSALSQVLDEVMGYKFWRFDIRVVLREHPGTLNYMVGLVGGQAPLSSHSICLPARQEQWRWVFYSCNGFHEDAPQAKYGGISNLWRDLLQRHGQVRYHLQVGGGDQLYADRLFHLPSLQPWLKIDQHEARAREPFTPVMLQQVEQFYFGTYMAHFADPAFAAALAAIPFTFSWDGAWQRVLQQRCCCGHQNGEQRTGISRGCIATRACRACGRPAVEPPCSSCTENFRNCPHIGYPAAAAAAAVQTMTSLTAGEATQATCSAVQCSRACLLLRGASTCCSSSTAATTTPQPSVPHWASTATIRSAASAPTCY